MEDIQLRDEVVRDRVRAAEEFLDPGMACGSPPSTYLTMTSRPKSPIVSRRYHSHAQ
jgi:hypothetical protein